MIKQIIFDWGGVCCTPAEPFANDGFQRAVGLDVDATAMRVQALYDGYYTGKISTPDFWEGILSHFKITDITPQEMIAAYIDSYSLKTGTIELIHDLRKRFKVTLLSNLTPVMKDHIIKTHELRHLFSHMIFSCDVGMMKPDPLIYEHVIKQYSVMPDEMLFIDDSEKNIKAASEAGINTILFKGENPIFKIKGVLE